MFLITNRRIITKAGTSHVTLGDRPNEEGPKELRAVEVVGSASSPTLREVPDRIPESDLPQDAASREALSRLNLSKQNGKYPGSAYVALKTLPRLASPHSKPRSLLLYVHGYNTPTESVIRTARELEQTYEVTCLPFTWPSNGGGERIWEDARGYASYLSDKRDARSSVTALDRAINRLADYIEHLHADARNTLEKAALQRFPHDNAARQAYLARGLEKICPVSVNLLLHSMGNYLFEYVILSESNLASRRLVFDNVIMAAADVNNAGHAAWVDRIPFRKNLYITINEDDFALKMSRAKLGAEQKPRLGHFRHALNAANAKYVDFTNASHVGKAHTYFLEKPIQNQSVRAFFQSAFHAGRGEEAARARYDAAENVYRLG